MHSLTKSGAIHCLHNVRLEIMFMLGVLYTAFVSVLQQCMELHWSISALSLKMHSQLYSEILRAMLLDVLCYLVSNSL